MRILVFVAIMVVLLSAGCSPALSSSSVKLNINGTEVSSVPWGEHVGTITQPAKLGKLFYSESASDSKKLAAFDSGPWYILPLNSSEIVIDRSNFPGVWDDEIHGLYTTTLELITDGKNRTEIGDYAMVQPTSVSESRLTYKLVEESESWADGEYQYTSMILLVATPYEKGGFYISCHKRGSFSFSK